MKVFEIELYYNNNLVKRALCLDAYSALDYARNNPTDEGYKCDDWGIYSYTLVGTRVTTSFKTVITKTVDDR